MTKQTPARCDKLRAPSASPVGINYLARPTHVLAILNLGHVASRQSLAEGQIIRPDLPNVLELLNEINLSRFF